MMYNIEKGREEGLEEGRKEGQEQERHRIVLSMLQKGFLYETISQITGIPAEEIAAIAQSQAWPIKE